MRPPPSETTKGTTARSTHPGSGRTPCSKALMSRNIHQLRRAGSQDGEGPSTGDTPQAPAAPDLGPAPLHLRKDGQITNLQTTKPHSSCLHIPPLRHSTSRSHHPSPPRPAGVAPKKRAARANTPKQQNRSTPPPATTASRRCWNPTSSHTPPHQPRAAAGGGNSSTTTGPEERDPKTSNSSHDDLLALPLAAKAGQESKEFTGEPELELVALCERARDEATLFLLPPRKQVKEVQQPPADTAPRRQTRKARSGFICGDAGLRLLCIPLLPLEQSTKERPDPDAPDPAERIQRPTPKLHYGKKATPSTFTTDSSSSPPPTQASKAGESGFGLGWSKKGSSQLL